jgi:undecaprenyl-diphosphatase
MCKRRLDMTEEMKRKRRRRKKINPIITCMTGLLFVILMILVMKVDVGTVEATGTTIGLYHLNPGFAALS